MHLKCQTYSQFIPSQVDKIRQKVVSNGRQRRRRRHTA